MRTAVLIADILAFITITALHFAASLMTFGNPYYLRVLWLDNYYVYFFGIPWTACGILKGFIKNFGGCEKRLIAAIITGLTFFVVWYTVDCAVLYHVIDTTFTELFCGTFFKTIVPFYHAGYFFISYLIRAELPNFIRSVKDVGFINTIFGEED